MAVLDTASAVVAITKDPYLPKVTGLVLELEKMESSATGRSAPGIGLRQVYGPLKLWVSMRKHPYITAAVLVGVVGGIYVLGYKSGKGR